MSAAGTRGTAGTGKSRRSPRVGRVNDRSNATVVIAAWTPNSPANGRPATPAAPLAIAPMLAAQKMAPNARERTTESPCSRDTSPRFEPCPGSPSVLGTSACTAARHVAVDAPYTAEAAAAAVTDPASASPATAVADPSNPQRKPACQAHLVHQPAHRCVRQRRAGLLHGQDHCDGPVLPAPSDSTSRSGRNVSTNWATRAVSTTSHTRRNTSGSGGRRRRRRPRRPKPPRRSWHDPRSRRPGPASRPLRRRSGCVAQATGRHRESPCVRRQSTAPGGAVGPGRDHHLCTGRRHICGEVGPDWGRGRAGPGDDSPEPEVCEKSWRKPLVRGVSPGHRTSLTHFRKGESGWLGDEGPSGGSRFAQANTAAAR